MKLVDLAATQASTKFNHPLVVNLDTDTFNQLTPYRDNREASGFVRLAIGVLLAVVNGSKDGDLGVVADDLVVSCASDEDLWTLTANLHSLWQEVESKAKQIERDK
jgi:hypothetical protein